MDVVETVSAPVSSAPHAAPSMPRYPTAARSNSAADRFMRRLLGIHAK